MPMQKDYTWAVSLIGGILALIAFFTPAVPIDAYDGSIYLWVWGLISYDIYNSFLGIYDIICKSYFNIGKRLFSY